jgi:hypothetical protein
MLHEVKLESELLSLTESGNTLASPIPTNRPQAAPVKREGMKSPLDTLSPYVQHDSRKYKMKNTATDATLCEPETEAERKLGNSQ